MVSAAGDAEEGRASCEVEEFRAADDAEKGWASGEVEEVRAAGKA